MNLYHLIYILFCSIFFISELINFMWAKTAFQMVEKLRGEYLRKYKGIYGTTACVLILHVMQHAIMNAQRLIVTLCELTAFSVYKLFKFIPDFILWWFEANQHLYYRPIHNFLKYELSSDSVCCTGSLIF